MGAFKQIAKICVILEIYKLNFLDYVLLFTSYFPCFYFWRQWLRGHPSIPGACIEKESADALLLWCSTLALGLVKKGSRSGLQSWPV